MERSWDLENVDAGMVELAMYSLCYLLCGPDTYCLLLRFHHVLEKYWAVTILVLEGNPAPQSLRQKDQDFETLNYRGRRFLIQTHTYPPLCGVCLVLALCSGFGPGTVFWRVWALFSGFGFSTLSASLSQPWLDIPLSLGPLAVKRIGWFFNFPFSLVTLSITLVSTLPSQAQHLEVTCSFSVTASPHHHRR